MSDVSKTNDRLVKALRRAAKLAEWYQTGEGGLLRAAADALATRQPTEGDREVTEVQRAVWSEIHGQDSARLYSVAEVKRLVYSLDNVISGLLARAVVPDAATESAAKYIRVQAKANARWRRLANKTIRDAEAERDAALAAVERVRAVLANDELVWSDGSYTNDLVVEVKDVLAALDGAPEPEAKP